MKTNIIFFIFRSVFLRMKNISDNSCKENPNTHFMLHNFFFENRDVYEIMWKNVVERDKPQLPIWGMRIACRIPKATNTLTIRNNCFSTAKVVALTHLNVMYTACLVINLKCKALKYSCRAPYSVLTFNLCQIYSATT